MDSAHRSYLVCIFLTLLSFTTSQDYQPQINSLNSYINGINNQMSQNSGQVNQLWQEVYAFGNQIWNLNYQTNNLMTTYTTLEAAVDKLNKVNYMWSKNFKIMEMTFKQIRRNVDFTVQNPKFN